METDAAIYLHEHRAHAAHHRWRPAGRGVVVFYFGPSGQYPDIDPVYSRVGGQ